MRRLLATLALLALWAMHGHAQPAGLPAVAPTPTPTASAGVTVAPTPTPAPTPPPELQLELMVLPGKPGQPQPSLPLRHMSDVPQSAIIATNNASRAISGMLEVTGTDILHPVELPPNSRRLFTYLPAINPARSVARENFKARLLGTTGVVLAESTAIQPARTSPGIIAFALGVSATDSLADFASSGFAPVNMGASSPGFIQNVPPELVPRHPNGWGAGGLLFLYPEALDGLDEAQVAALKARIDARTDRIVFISRGLAAPFGGTWLEPYLPATELGDAASVEVTDANGASAPSPLGVTRIAPKRGAAILRPTVPLGPANTPPLAISDGRRIYLAFDPNAPATAAWAARAAFLGSIGATTGIVSGSSPTAFLGDLNTNGHAGAVLRYLDDAVVPTVSDIWTLIAIGVVIGMGLIYLGGRLKRSESDPARDFWWLPAIAGTVGTVALVAVVIASPSRLVAMRITYVVPRERTAQQVAVVGVSTLRPRSFAVQGPEHARVALTDGQGVAPLRQSMPSRTADMNRMENISLRRRERDIYHFSGQAPFTNHLTGDALTTETLTLRLAADAPFRLEDIQVCLDAGYTGGSGRYTGTSPVLAPGAQTVVAMRPGSNLSLPGSTLEFDAELAQGFSSLLGVLASTAPSIDPFALRPPILAQPQAIPPLGMFGEPEPTPAPPSIEVEGALPPTDVRPLVYIVGARVVPLDPASAPTVWLPMRVEIDGQPLVPGHDVVILIQTLPIDLPAPAAPPAFP